VVFVAIAMVAGAPPALAHAKLTSSIPADGATLSASPAEVTFVFDESLVDGSTTISINDENGELVGGGPVTPSGKQATLVVTQPLPAGDYQAAYRVVSGDGHPVTGAIAFSVSAAAPSSGPGTPAPATAATPAASEASSEPSSAASGGAAPAAGLSPAAWLVVIVIIAAIAGAATFAVRRRPTD
jgi:methionine-rich copper-binding protein CopC